MKKHKTKNQFLAELRRIPIVQVAAEKTNVSRNSVYRWRNEDVEFAKLMDEALAEGEALVNDMSESQLLSLIKEKNFHALSFWLRHRNPRFKDKVEVTTKVENLDQLTPEQEATVREALRLASIIPTEVNNIKQQNHDKSSNQSGSIRRNDEESKGPNSNNQGKSPDVL
ncbi:TPA: hypothetical protein DCQ44_00890 [Candidatus Taylorbacteria bacterium]|nr:hypothetical protein [Candidatus Taylorbacteria bacterium]